MLKVDEHRKTRIAGFAGNVYKPIWEMLPEPFWAKAPSIMGHWA